MTTSSRTKETNGDQSPRDFGPQYIEFLRKQTSDEGGLYLEEHVLEPPLFDQLGKFEGQKVLEIGCGYGVNTHRLLRGNPRRIRAIDLSQDMINLAEASLGDSHGDTVKFKTMSADKLQYDNDEFDLAASAFVIENMPDDVVTGTFNEAHRVLKQGSRFVVVTIHPTWFLLVSGGKKMEDSEWQERFRKYGIPHVLTIEKTDRHTYTRFYRPAEWYNQTAAEAGFCLKADMALAIPSPEDDANLPEKYHPKTGWPVFRITTWIKE